MANKSARSRHVPIRGEAKRDETSRSRGLMMVPRASFPLKSAAPSIAARR
jgi:hypothetical protein